eukprot:scaffold59200_cov31-Attheya_sp.AAC.1
MHHDFAANYPNSSVIFSCLTDVRELVDLAPDLVDLAPDLDFPDLDADLLDGFFSPNFCASDFRDFLTADFCGNFCPTEVGVGCDVCSIRDTILLISDRDEVLEATKSFDFCESEFCASDLDSTDFCASDLDATDFRGDFLTDGFCGNATEVDVEVDVVNFGCDVCSI